jgi:hypothetical protein
VAIPSYQGGPQFMPGVMPQPGAMGGAMQRPGEGGAAKPQPNAMGTRMAPAPPVAAPAPAPQTWVGQSTGLPQYWEGMTHDQIMRATGQGQPSPQPPVPELGSPFPPVNASGAPPGVLGGQMVPPPAGEGMGGFRQPQSGVSSKAMEPMGPAPKPVDRFSGMGIGMSMQPPGQAEKGRNSDFMGSFVGAQKPGNMKWGRAMGMGMQPGVMGMGMPPEMGRSQRFSSMMPPAQNSGAAYDIFAGQLGNQKKF